MIILAIFVMVVGFILFVSGGTIFKRGGKLIGFPIAVVGGVLILGSLFLAAH